MKKSEEYMIWVRLIWNLRRFIFVKLGDIE